MGLLRAIKSQSLAMQLALPLFAVLPYLSFLVIPGGEEVLVHNAQGRIYQLYATGLIQHPVLYLVGSVVLLSLISTFLFWFNVRFELLGQRSVSISYFYLFLVSIPAYLTYLHPAFIATLCVLIGLRILLSLYQVAKPAPRIFNAGIFFGLAILFYPPFLALLPIYIIGLFRMKQPFLKEFAVLFLGALLPIWFYVGILLLWGDLGYEWISFKQWFEFRKTWPISLPGSDWISFAWLAWLLFLFPMTLVQTRNRKDVGRRVFGVMVHLVWISPAIWILFEKVSVEIWSLLSLPLALLFSKAVMDAKGGWMSKLLLLSFFIFLILFQLDHILWTSSSVG